MNSWVELIYDLAQLEFARVKNFSLLFPSLSDSKFLSKIGASAGMHLGDVASEPLGYLVRLSAKWALEDLCQQILAFDNLRNSFYLCLQFLRLYRALNNFGLFSRQICLFDDARWQIFCLLSFITAHINDNQTSLLFDALGRSRYPEISPSRSQLRIGRQFDIINLIFNLWIDIKFLNFWETRI